MPPETVAALLAEGRRRLAASGSATALLDARLLLQHAAGLRHEEVAGEPQLATEAGERFRKLIARREAHEPVSRILGEREFFGRSFKVTPAVLDPRPDTETLVEAALACSAPQARLLELGTGSGVVIVSLLAERLETTGIASDLSGSALDVAADNAVRHGVRNRLDLVHGDWFDGIEGQFDVIVSNPPYIPLADIGGLPPDVRCFDPLRALDGGPDGLEAYRRIAGGARSHLRPGGRVLVEIGAGQQNDVEALFRTAGFTSGGAVFDLGGLARCLTFS